MPDKEKSQIYNERQSRLIELIQESFYREEMAAKEVITSLRMIGISESIAANQVNEWKVQENNDIPETDKEKKQRLGEQASLENYILNIRLGKKKYEELTKLRSKYKNKELSRNVIVIELMQFGYNRKFSESTVDKWDSEKW